jgi:hypothetical protein
MTRFALLVGAAAALAGCVTPGVSAAVHRDPARLRQILDRPNHGDEDLANVLSNSIAFDCAECARLLLDAGAKPGADSLSAAALAGNEKIARLLVDAGADPSTAMFVIHARTRKWVGGAGISAEEARNANVVLKKLERERAAGSGAPAPVAAAAVIEEKPRGERIVPVFHEEERADDYALIVGAEDYDVLPAAAYARRDGESAADFAKALGMPAGNVVTLSGVHATRGGLAKNLEGWLADNVDGESTVYFYFSGRGASDPKSGEAYLIPFDGDPRYLAQTGYPLKRAYEKLGGLKAKRVIVVLDASFSGAGARSVPAEGGSPTSGGVDAGFNSVDGKVALLAAADAGQESGISAERGHGLFTYFLLDGLNGAAKDASGRVTLKSMFEYARTKVVSEARRERRVQVPLFESGGTVTDEVVLRAGQRGL